MMAWVTLVVAGVLEVVWLIALKYSEGFTRPLAATVTLTAGGLSFYLLAQALKVLPAGTAYAVWTGIGAVGSAIMGMLLFGESRDIPRLFSILLIVIGIAGLRLSSTR